MRRDRAPGATLPTMTPWASIDLYCERLDPGLLAEPLNLVSNAAFFIAAFMGALWLRAQPSPHRALWALPLIAACIGVGSSLFHSVATGWALIADVVPIGLYLVTYLGVTTRLLLRFSWKQVFAAYAAFLGVNAACILLISGESVGGSQGYFGSAATLFALGVGLRHSHPRPSRLFLYAGALFCLSLTCRSVDAMLCASIPLGTHWAWHILNGAVVACTLRAAIMLDAHRSSSAIVPLVPGAAPDSSSRP